MTLAINGFAAEMLHITIGGDTQLNFKLAAIVTMRDRPGP